MDRQIPSSSKLIQKRKKQNDDHKLYRKLKSIKNSESVYNFRKNDTKLPKKTKTKGFYQRQKNIEIQRENLILANKMINIGKKTTIPYLKKPKKLKENPKNPKKSLNKEKRKKNMLKITLENVQIMNRIQSMKSFYNTNKWKRDNYAHQERLKLHCEYPVVLEKLATKKEFQVNFY